MRGPWAEDWHALTMIQGMSGASRRGGAHLVDLNLQQYLGSEGCLVLRRHASVLFDLQCGRGSWAQETVEHIEEEDPEYECGVGVGALPSPLGSDSVEAWPSSMPGPIRPPIPFGLLQSGCDD